MPKVKNVQEYINRYPEWEKTLNTYRDIILQTGLEEHIRWGAPYYSLKGKNVVGFVAFKNHTALWFPNGVFLDDPDNRLINASEGVTKGGRQLRFYPDDEIDIPLIRNFVLQAIENQKAGKVLKPEKSKGFEMPAELKEVLENNTELEKAFKAFTPFKQKEFAEHISSAKREATRHSRVEKIIPMILRGEGLNDKYR